MDREAALALFDQYQDRAGRVASLAMRHLPRRYRWAEVHAAALVGLWRAACSFDPALGVPFGAHAWRRMRGAVLDWLRSQQPRSCQRGRCPLPVLRPLPVEGRGEGGAASGLADPRQPEPGQAREHAEGAAALLRGLSARDAAVARFCWLEGRTQSQAAAQFRLSPARVSQVLTEAARFLRGE